MVAAWLGVVIVDTMMMCQTVERLGKFKFSSAASSTSERS